MFEWEILDYFDENHQIKTRDNHSAVIDDNNQQMIVFGGFIEGDRNNEVIIYDFQ